MPPNLARFIKNLVYEVVDTADAGGGGKGSQTGVFKPFQTNAPYIEDFVLPPGNSQAIGQFSFRDLREVYVFLYNDQGHHTIYRLNGSDQTYNIVYQGPCLNFQLEPQYFIAQGGCWLEQTFVSDSDTGQQLSRTFLMFTDGFNPQRFISVEDSIDSQSFNPVLFPYFKSDFDPCLLIDMGVPTPSDCIQVTEIPLDPTAETENNRLLFNTWQFRELWTDVWGRPSEHGIISDMYIPGQGDCISNSSGLPRCLDLSFQAPPPYINSIQIEYRNCNSTQWYLADTLQLYNGSPLGKWWLRVRNDKIAFDSNTNTISYTFCAEGGCDPIAPADTNRLENPLPRTSQSVTKVGSFIALGNNVDGFLPFSQDLLDKITYTVTPPAATEAAPTRTMSILVEIYNPYFHLNTPIYTAKIGAVNFFGYGAYGLAAGLQNFQLQKQYFINPAQSGFVGSLAGTSAYTISEQWQLDPTGVFSKVTNFTVLNTKNRFFQKFTFTNLKAQTYIFRMTSPQSDPLVDPKFLQTSSNLRGTYRCNFANPSDPVDHSSIIDDAKELIINVCDADYDTTKDNRILAVWDLQPSTTRAGYVKNTSDPTQDQIGIELLNVGFSNPQQITSKYTDPNGYYFVSTTADGQGSTYNIKGFCNCKYISLTGSVDTGSGGSLIENDWFLDTDTLCPDYATEPCNFIIIRGRILLCNSNIPVPGVGVVLSRGRTAVTDVNGNFSIIAHDDCNGPNDGFIISSIRHDNLYFITSSCNFTACDGDCIPAIAVAIQKSITCQPREVDVRDTPVMYTAFKGLLTGGIYPVGLTGWDLLDRPGFVQPRGNITMPSVTQTQVFAPSQVTVNIDPSAVFPEDVKYLTFWIGQETSIEEYITWIVDSVVFIDNTGLENDTTPTQIKIFYASLIEYNKQNNFNTTVNWNFIPAGQNTPVLTDRVEFLLNGDGTYFPKATSALVKYDMTGQYFLVNYTSDLANLKANAIIRLVRPKQCTGTEPYFEICRKIPVVNRHATINSFILNAFDTYYINREIPVPTLQVGSSPPSFINELRLFGVPFESASPSDFWGQGCQNIGRVNTKNPYETVIYSPDQIALSGALAVDGQLNFLNQFDDANKKDFSDTLIDGITALLPETSTILVLGQTDSFIVGFNDNIARVNDQGQVMAPSIENKFGQPERKIGSNYGCMLYDKNTIYKKEGIVQFLDTSKAAVIQHNYQTAIPMSNNGAEGLIRTKIKEVQAFNSVNTNNRRYFTGVIDPINHAYLLTDFIVKTGTFINNLREFDPKVQETLVFDVFGKSFKGTVSYTPECYAELEGELNDQQLFSFKNGVPYRHYTSLGTTTYNTFYGVICERIVEVVIVMDNLKKKKPLSIAEYCKQGAYFADRVVTETGQLSRILLGYFLEAEFGWYGPFLCDLNTPFDPNLPIQTGPNVLLDGNMLTGTWIKVRLVGDPAVNDQYSEFQGMAVEVFPSEKSGVK